MTEDKLISKIIEVYKNLKIKKYYIKGENYEKRRKCNKEF